MPPLRRSIWLRELSGVSSATKEEVRRLLNAARDGDVFEQPLAEARVPAHDPVEPQLRVGELLADRFEVIRFLGRGGMGEVYAVHDRMMGQTVAIKLVYGLFASRPETLKQVRREIKIARSIRHPNVCAVFDIHQAEKRDGGELVFLSMGLLEGRTLHARIAEGPMPLSEVSELCGGIAAGIDAIHEAGIVHRDLKSGNIMLVGPNQKPVILDFGLSHDFAGRTSPTILNSHAIVGTPPFMAPEQLRGETAGPAADIHAFGVILYHALTGTLPFDAETTLAVALRRLNEEAPRLKSVAPRAGRQWDRAVACCLQTGPGDRPKSGAEVVAIVEGRSAGRLRIPRRRIAAFGTVVLVVGVSAYVALNRPHVPPAAAEIHFKQAEEFAKRRTRESNEAATAEYRRAVELDPEFAAAWAGLADSYTTAVNFAFMNAPEARANASAALRRALALDSDLPKAILAQAYLHSVDFAKWKEAGDEFRRALRHYPQDARLHSAYAAYLGRAGSHAEAVEHARTSVALDPASLSTNNQLAMELFRAGRLAEFLAQAKEAVRLQPLEASGHQMLARALEWNGDLDGAEREVDLARKYGRPENADVVQATILVARGRRAEAEALAHRLRSGGASRVETNSLVSIYAALGDAKGVVAVLEAGYRSGDGTVLAAATNPYMMSVKSDPDVQNLLKRLGF